MADRRRPPMGDLSPGHPGPLFPEFYGWLIRDSRITDDGHNQVALIERTWQIVYDTISAWMQQSGDAESAALFRQHYAAGGPVHRSIHAPDDMMEECLEWRADTAPALANLVRTTLPMMLRDYIARGGDPLPTLD